MVNKRTLRCRKCSALYDTRRWLWNYPVDVHRYLLLKPRWCALCNIRWAFKHIKAPASDWRVGHAAYLGVLQRENVWRRDIINKE